VSELADRYNFVAICTTHTNKGGVFEGSAQIRAKCRMFAKVHRPTKLDMQTSSDGMVDLRGAHDPQWVTYVTNEKAQRGKQHARYAFSFAMVPSRNPLDGKIDVEMDKDGNLVEIEQYVCVGHEEVENTSLPPEPVAPERPDLKARIVELLANEPSLSIEKVARAVNARTSDVATIMRELRKK
jgi:hypothetical protein